MLFREGAAADLAWSPRVRSGFTVAPGGTEKPVGEVKGTILTEIAMIPMRSDISPPFPARKAK